MDEEKLKEFPTYSALEREALVWGVPVYWFAVIAFLGLIGSFVICLIFGWKIMLAWALLLAVIFIVVHIMCELDSKAMKKIEKMLIRIWMNIKHGRSLFLTPYNVNWSKVAKERQALDYILDKRNKRKR